MKKIMFAILYLLFVNSFLICESVEYPYFHGQYMGDEVVVFGNDPVIYEKPDQKSKKIQVPVPGTVLKLIGPGPGSLDFDGYVESWYEVGVMAENGKMLQGYIWGGSLAKAFIMDDFDGDGKQEAVVMGVKNGKRKEGTENAKLRYVKDGVVKSAVLFAPVNSAETDERMFSENDISAALVNSSGFIPPIKMFKISFLTGTCESVSGDLYFYFDGKKLKKAFEVIEGSGDVISEKAVVYMPSTDKSMLNQVVVKTAAIPIYNEEKVKPWDVTIYTVTYGWNGKSFIKGKEKETVFSWKTFKSKYPEFSR